MIGKPLIEIFFKNKGISQNIDLEIVDLRSTVNDIKIENNSKIIKAVPVPSNNTTNIPSSPSPSISEGKSITFKSKPTAVKKCNMCSGQRILPLTSPPSNHTLAQKTNVPVLTSSSSIVSKEQPQSKELPKTFATLLSTTTSNFKKSSVAVSTIKSSSIPIHNSIAKAIQNQTLKNLNLQNIKNLETAVITTNVGTTTLQIANSIIPTQSNLNPNPNANTTNVILNAMSTSQWGIPLWKKFHTTAANYEKNPTKQDASRMKTTIENMINHEVICPTCLREAKEWLKINPLNDGVLKDRYTLSQWVLKFHNDVNVRLGKKVWTFDEMVHEHKLTRQLNISG